MGRDFLKRHGIVIDHAKDSILVDPSDGVNESDWHKVAGEFSCITLNHVVLEPRSETVLMCKNLNLEENKELIFTPKCSDPGVY